VHPADEQIGSSYSCIKENNLVWLLFVNLSFDSVTGVLLFDPNEPVGPPTKARATTGSTFNFYLSLFS